MLRPKLCGNSWLHGCANSCVAGVLPRHRTPNCEKIGSCSKRLSLKTRMTLQCAERPQPTRSKFCHSHWLRGLNLRTEYFLRRDPIQHRKTDCSSDVSLW